MLYQNGILINHMELTGRIVMPPMATRTADADGNVSEQLIEFYRERAKNRNISMIIAEHSYINKQGKASKGQMSMDEHADMDGLKRLTAAVHQYGVKIMAQISHAGVVAASDETGIPTVAPSAVLPPVLPSKAPDEISMPEELTVEEIHKIEIDFVKAALRAKEAGFDGVEIHSAHGYLLSQFYSPLLNKREDQYGRQTIENATRFHVETLKAVRTAVGEDYPISIRLGGVDYIDGGSTVDDCVKACRILASAGADLLDLTGGITGFMRPGHTEAGYFKEMSIAAKKVTDVSVMLTGGVTTIAEAESLLEGNACDLVGVGRAILKNPAWE